MLSYVALAWPWPREIALSFFENFNSSASLYSSLAGSVPVDKTKIKGITEDDSLKTSPRLIDWNMQTKWKDLDTSSNDELDWHCQLKTDLQTTLEYTKASEYRFYNCTHLPKTCRNFRPLMLFEKNCRILTSESKEEMKRREVVTLISQSKIWSHQSFFCYVLLFKCYTAFNSIISIEFF